MSRFEESEVEDSQLLVNAAAEIYGMRRARDRVIPAGLVGEPAWDILLALYAEQPGKIAVASLCQASGVLPTTAMRWISALETENLVVRTSSPQGSLALISLTDKGRLIVEHSLKAMLRVARE